MMRHDDMLLLPFYVSLARFLVGDGSKIISISHISLFANFCCCIAASERFMAFVAATTAANQVQLQV